MSNASSMVVLSLLVEQRHYIVPKQPEQDFRRFLKKNLPRCGPRRCGQTPRLPPAGGGWRGERVDGVLPPHHRLRDHPPPGLPPLGGGPTLAHGMGGRRSGVEMRGEPLPEVAFEQNETERPS